MNQSRFRRLVALLMKTLGRQVRRTIRTQGVPITPEQRADVAAALLPHIRRARAQSHTLGVAMLEPQARALGIVTPPARPVRPYNQQAVETMLENVTNIHPRPSRARVTVDPDAPEDVRGPRVTVAALDPVTRRRARVTVDVTEENRRDPQVVKAVTARLEAAAERHARMPSREALTDALEATPIVPLRASPDEDPEADFVWDDDDLLSPDDVNAGRAAIIGWARVLTGAESCPWCAMLASRGPVFNSERDALYITSRSERFDSRELKKYHDNCDCEIVMVREGVDWNGREQYEALEQLWIESTLDTSGDDSVKAFAQAFNQRAADGDIDQFIAKFPDEDTVGVTAEPDTPVSEAEPVDRLQESQDRLAWLEESRATLAWLEAERNFLAAPPALSADYDASVTPEQRASIDRDLSVIPLSVRQQLAAEGVLLQVGDTVENTPLGAIYRGQLTSDGRPLTDGVGGFYDPPENAVLISSTVPHGSVNVIAHELGHALDYTALRNRPVDVEMSIQGTRGQQNLPASTLASVIQKPRVRRITQIVQDPYLEYAHEMVIASTTGREYFKSGSAGTREDGRREWIAEGIAAIIEGDDAVLLEISGGSAQAADILKWSLRRLEVLP
ncbi:VG15 protein [Rhodococcus qingshengii]|uniref:VG15 protein n=1 Tax=Rhodococcus qingshengii TaxID=334542 RepID=UPI001BEB3663|nr:hypothetical protein [Rhodococcus qingshengii]MBT2273880.1 hypothetical protein [Rhodococcus qingshengii]